jgi:pyruvate,water dikinase
VEDDAALEEAASAARELILEVEVPDTVVEDLLGAYDELGGEFVAVRSSATTEDLPEASFAGQQETLLNVTRADLADAVRQCWASLFTARAVYYRERHGFDHGSDIAVVVQQMVDAQKSGVLFTRHPSTGAPETVVEAAWGLGEGVVSGTVSPDNYVVRDDDTDVTVAEQETMFVRDGDTGETVQQSVPEHRADGRVLTDGELADLVALGDRVEEHYDAPQDVEWAIADGEVYLLQSRPITTLEEDGEDDTLTEGIGASPGSATGLVRVVERIDQLERVGSGDVLVTEMTTPDMIAAMQRAAALVTDRGGMTSHAAIVARELGVPAVVGTGDATSVLEEDQNVTVDGDRGTVTAGTDGADENEDDEATTVESAKTAVAPVTATTVKANVSIPEAADRAAATDADGVGLLRLEHMVLSTNATPARYVDTHGEDGYVDMLVEGVGAYAEAFYPRPVRVRTLDAPTDEFRQLEGGAAEPDEHNPMLGYRGFRRSVQEPALFGLELEAFARLYEEGYDNLEVMVPLVGDESDVRLARERFADAGIDPDERRWGTMVETPSSALRIDEILDEGVDFVSIGTNDLTQYTLAVDRNNGQVADRYDETHPAVLDLVDRVVGACNDRGVDVAVCGQAASRPEMAAHLVENGIDSLSVDVDALAEVRETVARVERGLLLDAARD